MREKNIEALASIIKFERTIKSDLNEIKVLITEAIQYLDTLGDFSDEKRNDIRVIISELLINALYHGNSNDMSKDIKLLIHLIKENQLFIQVEDEGKGLKENIIRNKKDIARQRQFSFDENGRGLIIISELSDSLFTRGEGKKVCTKLWIKEKEMKL